MTKTLLKKQMMELFSFLWQDKKKNKNLTGIGLILSILLYLGIFGMLAVIFYFVADLLCEPLAEANMSWLYFSMTGVVGVVMGAFGSIFNTYAGLYLAKDNNLLMAMPIPPSKILRVRLSGVYAMGLFYEMLVMIPVLIRYFVTVKPTVISVFCAVWITLMLSVFVLILSTVLGWAAARISEKTKHKSLITVILSLTFIIGYYYLYAMAMSHFQEIAANPQIAGDFIKGYLSPIYQIGLAAEGNLIAVLWVTITVFGLFGIVYVILVKSYLKMITSNKGEAKVKYKEQPAAFHSVDRALLGKEFRRFLSSPTYMLNCGLGIVVMVAAAVALLIKADTVKMIVAEVFADQQGMIPLLITAAVCMMTTMNDITAPSVSLEGKNLWIVQVFPVSGWQVLMAKLKLHLILTLAPAAILVISVQIVLKLSFPFSILIPMAVALFILFMALFGLTLNLKMPNVTWTNEIIPIKQSMCVMITLFGGWILVMGLAGLYWVMRKYLTEIGYMVLVCVILLTGSMIMLRWIKKKGTKIFETL